VIADIEVPKVWTSIIVPPKAQILSVMLGGFFEVTRKIFILSSALE
jgi:hypothetical protein